MAVTTPRPPRPSDPVDRDDLETLVEALIEEARRRARRRRILYAAVAAAVALAGIVVFAVFDRTAHSQAAAPGGAARPGAPAGAARSQIAFARNLAGCSCDGHKEIHVMNPDGSGHRLLARETGLGDMAWSPDGREILYGSLFVVRADGSGVRQLTRNAQAYGFDWAHNGKIAFTTVRGGYRDIWVINADGSGERRLV